MKFNLKSFRLGDFLSKRINTILLIVILIVILTGHVVCSCSRMSASKVVEKLTSRNTTTKETGSSESNKPFAKKIEKILDIKTMLNKKKPMQESFIGGANTNNGQSAPYLLGSPGGTVTVDINSWNKPDLVVKCDGSYGKGVSDILGRQKQSIPLPEGQLDIFATTPFKAECCPNFYSNSTGCACMTTEQYNYLQLRGGNNAPYSEY
uniref:Uncharacterized protein n=1 Tax=viral metagenome TaxID=1070528 RepID=A0A6C0E8A5_9ZZZZ